MGKRGSKERAKSKETRKQAKMNMKGRDQIASLREKQYNNMKNAAGEDKTQGTSTAAGLFACPRESSSPFSRSPSAQRQANTQRHHTNSSSSQTSLGSRQPTTAQTVKQRGSSTPRPRPSFLPPTGASAVEGGGNETQEGRKYKKEQESVMEQRDQ